MHGLEQTFLFLRFVAERLDPECRRRGVQNPHHDLFAKQGRQGADAKVDRAVFRQHQLHSPVLRHPLLRYVELGNHLDARGQFFLDRNRRTRDFAQDAVGPEANPVSLFVRFEVQVGRAVADGVHQHLLQETHHRGVVHVRHRGFFRLGQCFVVGEFEIQVLFRHVEDRASRRFGQTSDEGAELVVLDDHGVD